MLIRRNSYCRLIERDSDPVALGTLESSKYDDIPVTVSVVVLGGLGSLRVCPNAVSSGIIHLKYHRLQHLSLVKLCN
jgi:hypothetical protein